MGGVFKSSKNMYTYPFGNINDVLSTYYFAGNLAFSSSFYFARECSMSVYIRIEGQVLQIRNNIYYLKDTRKYTLPTKPLSAAFQFRSCNEIY